jgi:very-short-patch-repair endonuclease
VRTVIDCCLDLPFADALAVFDSSWRAGLKPREVQLAALRLPRRQRDKVLRVARAADPRAANPFESVLRAIARDVPGLSVTPQLAVGDSDFYARVDLADEALRIVIEADSFEFHSTRRAFDRDCRRYDGLVVRGWLVLRFSWEQVMFEPELVAATIAAAVELRRGRRRRTTGTTARPVRKPA